MLSSPLPQAIPRQRVTDERGFDRGRNYDVLRLSIKHLPTYLLHTRMYQHTLPGPRIRSTHVRTCPSLLVSPRRRRQSLSSSRRGGRPPLHIPRSTLLPYAAWHGIHDAHVTTNRRFPMTLKHEIYLGIMVDFVFLRAWSLDGSIGFVASRFSLSALS